MYVRHTGESELLSFFKCILIIPTRNVAFLKLTNLIATGRSQQDLRYHCYPSLSIQIFVKEVLSIFMLWTRLLGHSSVMQPSYLPHYKSLFYIVIRVLLLTLNQIRVRSQPVLWDRSGSRWNRPGSECCRVERILYLGVLTQPLSPFLISSLRHQSLIVLASIQNYFLTSLYSFS